MPTRLAGAEVGYLGLPPSRGFPKLHAHSAKTAKPCAYAAARVHAQYQVEPGAWAGSKLERMSVAGLRTEVGGFVAAMPRGTKTAQKYARSGMCTSSAELEAYVYGTVQEYVAERGVAGLPHTNGWRDLSEWVAARADAPPAAPRRPCSAGALAAAPIAALPASRTQSAGGAPAALPAFVSTPMGAAQLAVPLLSAMPADGPGSLSNSWQQFVWTTPNGLPLAAGSVVMPAPGQQPPPGIDGGAPSSSAAVAAEVIAASQPAGSEGRPSWWSAMTGWGGEMR